MNGLYALKPWYADRLSGVRGALARRRVSPTPSPPPASPPQQPPAGHSPCSRRGGPPPPSRCCWRCVWPAPTSTGRWPATPGAPGGAAHCSTRRATGPPTSW
ncbi:hypothetical protein NQP46_25250 [Streptomyces albus]|nr:hypothetical protein NQP46_25250 [Streptomyces albus]